MPTDPLDPEFSHEGAIAKPGQVVPPTNLPEQFQRGREAVTQLGAEMTGVADVNRMLSGEAPWTDAIAGEVVPMYPHAGKTLQDIKADNTRFKLNRALGVNAKVLPMTPPVKPDEGE